MNQMNLDQFEASVKKLSHLYDPDTSREAAEKMVKSGELNRQERKVLSAIKCCSDSAMKSFNFTAKELAEWTFIDIDYYTIQRRLSGLREKGKIRRTGKKRDGCCVWELV